MSCLTVENSAEFRTKDNIFVKEMNLPRVGMVVGQHAHKYGHTTLLVRGQLRAWRDGELLGEYCAPAQIFIPANTKHAFVSLEPDTLAYCIHRLRDEDDAVEITEAHDMEAAVRVAA
jgi:hypothetical protein